MTITMTMQQQDIYPSFAIEMAKLCAHRPSSDEPSSSFSSSPSSSSSSSSSSSFSASCSSPFDLLRLSDSGARHESSPFNSPKSSLRKSQKEEDEQEEGEVSPSEDNGCRKSQEQQEQQEQQEEEHLLKKTKITDENQPENEDSHSFCLSLVERATELKQRVSDYAQWLQLSHESYRKRITTIKRLHELLADLIQFINSLLLQQRNSVSKASFHFLLARFSREMAELNQVLADWSLFRYRPLPSRTIDLSEMRLTSWFAQLSHMFPLHFLPQLPTLSDSYRAPLSAPSTPLRSSSDSPLLSSPPSPSVLSPPPSPCPSPSPTLPSSSSTSSSSSSSLLSTPSLLSVPPPSSPLVESHPALLIQDLKARSAWEQAFGPFCAFVTIDTFLSQLICGQLLNIPPVSRISAVSTYSSISCSVFSPTFHSSSSSSSSSSSVSFSSTMTKTSTTVWPEQSAFLDTLRRVLSSSGQSVVTTYQWGQLVQMFGPMDHFLRNFSEFATNGAFFGYLHREEAHSILKNSPSNRVVLLRYSTTCPDFIAFSFKNSRGEIRHLLNQDERGQPIPVHRFFPAYFSAYSFVRP